VAFHQEIGAIIKKEEKKSIVKEGKARSRTRLSDAWKERILELEDKDFKITLFDK
jgi:hypothetical protein